MSHPSFDPRLAAHRTQQTHISSSPARLVFPLLLCLLLAQTLGNWGLLVTPALAASMHVRPSAPASLTYQHFLKQGRPGSGSHGPLSHPHTLPPLPGAHNAHTANYAQLPPSAEPPTMQPISQPLSSAFLFGQPGTPALDLLGSDHRLEVQLQPGALDLSHASVPGGKPPSGTLTLHLSQVHGHFAAAFTELGRYHLQILDRQGQVVSGVRLHTPVTFLYHYQLSEMAALGLDPGTLVLTWPTLIAAAEAAHQPTTNLILPMQENATAHTLTAVSHVLDPSPFDTSGGDPQNQSPPTSHLASVQGNSGQLAYSYPIQVPPGPGGFAPQLTLTYSSGDPNNRHSRTSPANNVGDGWTLSLGSISADVYPNTGTTWYFISGVANVGDRLIPNGSFYDTEHLSYLRIVQVTNTGQPCFHVWDKSGTYYELGCTSDSLQYWTSSSGTRTNYQWDVNKIIAPNEGPSAGTYKMLTVSYLQDTTTSGGYTTIRDAAIEQILYGTGDANTVTTVAGTVDFHYLAPVAQSPWAEAYGQNKNCTNPPIPTTLRCDDPLDFGTDKAPMVMSTLSLQSVTSYVGSDSGGSKAYGYAMTYTDSHFVQCNDPYSLANYYCAGEHLLSTVTPTVYLTGTAHALQPLNLSYGEEIDNYVDSTQKNEGGYDYGGDTYWFYLVAYLDTNTGVGAHISYASAHNNSDGTPSIIQGGQVTDDRYDALYCTIHTSDCSPNSYSGHYAQPDAHAWSVQVVTSMTSWGSDSSSVSAATTTYNYYRLAKTGQWGGGNSTWCYPDQQPPPNTDNDCVGDNWYPKNDGDWQDYYHSEFRGFGQVWTLSPANDLTVDTYYSTEGWNTPASDGANYDSGQMQEEDVYQGGNYQDTKLLRKTQYSWFNANGNQACRAPSATYQACEATLLSDKTIMLEGTGSNNSNAPWMQRAYTYDDFDNANGLKTGSVYHNLTQEVTSSSNASTLTQKWTYTPNDYVDANHNNWVYYIVDKATHSEVDDSSGTAWQCQDTTYDENAPGSPRTPDAGWPTTVKTYATCGQSGTAITSYVDYDTYGNVVATVDGLAQANPTLYSSHGCTLSTSPVVYSSGWGKTVYTSCTVYDPTTFNALPKTQTNALNQSTGIAYDPTQGDLPTSATDLNGQVTTTNYSYDNQGNRTVQVKAPLENNGYTTQSQTNSTCTISSTTPCFEIDSNASTYSSAITRTFYDSQGRAVETRTPGPQAGYDTIVFTVYNDAQSSVFQSVPFQVTSGSGWIDPASATDYMGHMPGGTATYDDVLGRPIATKDPLFGTGGDGNSCASLGGSATSCIVYGLGQVNGTWYAQSSSIDPNDHVSVSSADALNRIAYLHYFSGLNGQTLTLNEQIGYTYDALGQPTQVTTTDKLPLSGESTTSVTTSAQYDSMGRLTQLVDPETGTHTYSYDADSRLFSEQVGSHTLGYNDDLLGRVGCVQDAIPSTVNSLGNCTAGNPYIQNSYDQTFLGTQGTTDFPIGQLDKTLTTTYYPEGTSANVTEKFQHDQRGRLTQENLLFGLPGSWGVSTPLPTYKMNLTYTDANQLQTTTTSSASPSGLGYTTTQVYDSTTGGLYGVNNNTSLTTPDLATLSYNPNALVDTFAYQTSTGSALANQQYGYDANLRTTSMTTTWQGGSGQSGTILAQGLNYDPASNLVSLSTTQGPVPGSSSSNSTETQNFCYDEQGRLVWAGNSGTQPSPGNGTCGSGSLGNSGNIGAYSTSFVYTHLGQLWQGPTSGGSTQYQYLYCNSSAPHQLTGLYSLGATCSNKGTAAYATTYDAYGNVNQRTYSSTTGTLSYNNLNQMVEWNAGSTNQEWNVYDAAGNRVLTRSTNGSSTTLLVYPFGREEHQYSGSGTNQWNTYYYFLGSRLIGDLDANGTFYLLTDALDSILSDISWSAGGAAIKGSQLFGPYGNARASQGSINTAKGFTGQYNDSLTGLDYYVSRYYDPVVGVFLSADKTQGNLQGLDPYTYVGAIPRLRVIPPASSLWATAVRSWVWGHNTAGSTIQAISKPCSITPMAGVFRHKSSLTLQHRFTTTTRMQRDHRPGRSFWMRRALPTSSRPSLIPMLRSGRRWER